MTIEELKDKKADLESEILSIVSTFEFRTNTKVSEVVLERIDSTTKCGVAYITNVDVKIDL